MQGICQKIVRCLCSCLIKKEVVAYSEISDEGHKFMSLSDTIEDDGRNHKLTAQKQYSTELSTDITNKLSNYLEVQTTPQLKQVLKKQIYASGLQQSQHQQQQSLMKSESQQPEDYSDVIGETHAYYPLFKDKLTLLNHIFQIPINASNAEPDTAFPLKMYCYQLGKYNIFKYFFKFPTDFETYQSISSDFELQKNFDSNIDQFRKILETPEGDAKLIYLAYKKVLMMSSRDFEYVRYTFKKNSQFWNICVSDLTRQQIKGKVRGEMILTTTRIIPKGGEIQVSVSSQIDMKIPIKLEIAKNRGFAEIRKYLDKVYNHIKSIENKSII